MSCKKELKALKTSLEQSYLHQSQDIKQLIELLSDLPPEIEKTKKAFIIALNTRALEKVKSETTLQDTAQCLEQVRVALLDTFEERSRILQTSERATASIVCLALMLTPLYLSLALGLKFVEYAHQESSQAQQDINLLKELKINCAKLGLLPEIQGSIHQFFQQCAEPKKKGEISRNIRLS